MSAATATAEAIRFAQLAARAVTVRCVLRRLPGGRYELIRTGWGLHRDCDSLDIVDRLLTMMAASTTHGA